MNITVFFPTHNRENNANLETFCVIVAVEVTNSNSVCARRGIQRFESLSPAISNIQ